MCRSGPSPFFGTGSNLSTKLHGKLTCSARHIILFKDLTNNLKVLLITGTSETTCQVRMFLWHVFIERTVTALGIGNRKWCVSMLTALSVANGHATWLLFAVWRSRRLRRSSCVVCSPCVHVSNVKPRLPSVTIGVCTFAEYLCFGSRQRDEHPAYRKIPVVTGACLT